MKKLLLPGLGLACGITLVNVAIMLGGTHWHDLVQGWTGVFGAVICIVTFIHLMTAWLE